MSDSFLLDPGEQALIACDQQVLAMIDRYQHAVNTVEERGKHNDIFSARLADLQAQHQTLETALADRQRLPQAPEPDREQLSRLAMTIRSWVESDQHELLIDSLINNEREWIDHLQELDNAAVEDVPAEELLTSAEAAVENLSKLLTSSNT